MLPELGGKIFGGEINWYDLAMGVGCVIVLKSLELLKRRYCERQTLKPFVAKLIWLVGTARNAIVVIMAGSLGLYYDGPINTCLTFTAYILEHENIDQWRHGCQAGQVNCTRLTLTKIADTSMPG